MHDVYILYTQYNTFCIQAVQYFVCVCVHINVYDSVYILYTFCMTHCIHRLEQIRLGQIRVDQNIYIVHSVPVCTFVIRCALNIKIVVDE